MRDATRGELSDVDSPRLNIHVSSTRNRRFQEPKLVKETRFYVSGRFYRRLDRRFKSTWLWCAPSNLVLIRRASYVSVWVCGAYANRPEKERAERSISLLIKGGHRLVAKYAARLFRSLSLYRRSGRARSKSEFHRRLSRCVIAALSSRIHARTHARTCPVTCTHARPYAISATQRMIKNGSDQDRL